MLIYINGEFFNESQAKISVLDRGFLYGDSIYEVTSAENEKPLFLKEHLERLWRSGEKIGLISQWSAEEMTSELNKGIKKLGLARQYIRIIITRGAGEISLDPGKSDGQNLIMIFKELPENPKSWYQDGVSAIIADIRRNSKNTVDPSVKSGNYLNNVMAMKEAKEKGAFDAIMLNAEGLISECTTSNIWMVKDSTFYTPPLSAGLLGGITRQKLLELLAINGLSFQEKNFTPEEFLKADEAFLTSTTKELVPITKVDNTFIGQGKPGQQTQMLHKLYKEYIAK